MWYFSESTSLHFIVLLNCLLKTLIVYKIHNVIDLVKNNL